MVTRGELKTMAESSPLWVRHPHRTHIYQRRTSEACEFDFSLNIETSWAKVMYREKGSSTWFEMTRARWADIELVPSRTGPHRTKVGAVTLNL